MKKVLIALLFLLICKKEIAQVTPQTGSANYSLPMFNWQDNKSRLNTAISLDYNSGNGLKVNDVPSTVGQGWNLMAGGVISRMQVGEPDDQQPYFQFGSEQWDDVKKYPAGYLYAGFDIAAGVSNSLAYYPIFNAKNIMYKQHNDAAADKELDRFAFQFNGRTGIFILDKNTNSGVLLGDSKILISFVTSSSLINLQIRTTIDKFIITDENGIKYTFANHGTAKVLKVKYCNQDLASPITQPNFKWGNVYYENTFDSPSEVANPYIINNWYLTEAEDLLTHRKILYNYATRTISSEAGIAISYYAQKNYSVVSHSISKNTTQELSSITYPDGYVASFYYDMSNPRIDLPGDYPLSSLTVSYLSRYTSRFDFKTSYFILNRCGRPTSDYEKYAARLCLKSVKKTGPDMKADDPPTVFDYYMGSSAVDDVIPPLFTSLKDMWGFYNGDYSRDAANNASFNVATPVRNFSNLILKGLCFLRGVPVSKKNNPIIPALLNAKPAYAKNGLLKQITYPTGGAMQFEYAQNTGVIQGSVNNVGGVHVTKTNVTDGGYSNDCDHKIETNYSYNLEGSTSSSLWGTEMPLNSLTINSHYLPESKYYHYKFPFGECKYRYSYPGILSRDQAIDLTGHQKFLQTLSAVLNVVSSVMQIIDVITVCVSATPAAIVAVVIDVILGLVDLVVSCFGDPEKNSVSTIYYNSDLNGANPLPTQFKRVEIIESSGGNGKTVMEFTSTDDYALWEPTNPTFCMVQRFAPWAYGLLKKSTVYDASGNKVKETENSYDWNSVQRQYLAFSHPGAPVIPHLSCKYLLTSSLSMRSDTWLNPSNYAYPATYINTSNSNMLVKVYDIFTGRVPLSIVFERTYKPSSSQYAEKVTQYYYNVDYLPSSIITKQSDGSYKSNYIHYSGEYSDISIYNGPGQPETFYSAGILNTLNQNHVINIPVATSTYVQGGYLDEKVTEFISTNDGNVKPYRILEQRFNQPQPVVNQTTGQLNFHSYVLPGHPDNPPYKEIQTFTYDASGNLTGVKDEGNRYVTNIYDYDDKYVVASVINAIPITDKSAYTSFETSGLGGWSISGSAVYGNNSITGTRSFTLSSGKSITTSLNSGKSYKLSFWSTFPVTVSSGAALVISAPVKNGFTYYEYNVAQGTTGVTITGNASIDELRLYPQVSRMRTVTYDPIIGKTSECDENNRIKYYEYDDWGRLRFIKDDDKNIIKMYEYNLAKKPVCPGNYQNLLVSEIFIKNNCPSGYIGSTVTYSIPAGTYTSSISQDLVDQQTENDLLINGQAYANANGTCIQVYGNAALSQIFTKQGCPVGYIGSTVTYAVPQGKYTSTISQADADTQAQDEIDANGQAFANAPGNATCIIDYDADWIGTGLQECQGGHLMVQITDQNPNSSTYHQTQWVDDGTTCTAGNYVLTRYYTRNDCGAGYIGETIPVTVPANTYYAASQTDADQMASDYLDANGQNYANTNGACIPEAQCNTTNCPGPGYKCFNGVCQAGVRKNKSCVHVKINGSTWVYRCSYRYCFSDGTMSEILTEDNQSCCTIDSPCLGELEQ